MKKALILLLSLLTLLMFCSVYADDLADVQKAGVLRFGVPPEYIPFIIFDKDGNQSGIDIALMEEIGRRMGVKVETVNLAFDGMIDSLNIGQVDVIGGAFSKTDERMEKIDFTRVYYAGDAQFIGLATLTKPASVDLSSFRDLKIGVQKGTSFDQWIKTNLVGGGYVSVRNVYSYSSAADEMKALDRKDVDLVLIDQDVYEGLYRSTGKYQIFYDGFVKENYAFGLRKNSSLTSVVNGHLTDMLKDGTAQTIANRFFSMNFNEVETTIARPSQIATPTPAVPVPVVVPAQQTVTSCVNGMVFAADITIPDGYRLYQGQAFTKTWRVKNTGTCTWTPDYSFVYVTGDQMSGRNINVPTTVAPGQTVDLSVNLIAPYGDGSYRGYWQMRSPQGSNFGETIWVKVQVGNSAPVTPTQVPDGQRYAPINIKYFYPDYYAGIAGDCVRAYWAAEGASIVEVTVDGVSLYKGDVVNPGSLKLCGPIQDSGTHNVELYAFNVTSDAYSSFQYSTEGQRRIVPEINYFYADSDSGPLGECINVYWSVSNAAAVEIDVDGNQIEYSQSSSGTTPVCATIQSVGKHRITLTAHTVTDDATSVITYKTTK